MVVYEIENLKTNDCYIGITTNKLSVRITNHLNCHSKSGFSGFQKRTLMYEDFKHYGVDNFMLKILYQGKSKKQILAFESTVKSQDKYLKYSIRDILKDTSKKHNLKAVCLIDSKGKKSFFKSPSEVTKKFRCSRTNIIKAIKDRYLFKREYIAFYVSNQEATNQINLF